MEHAHRDDLERQTLPGRTVQRAIGRNAYSPSEVISVGFARYSAEAGPMEPHRHGEESIYVIDARDGRVEWGRQQDQMDKKCELAAGMVLHVPADEWHVFRHAEGGFIDILFVFAPPLW